MAWLLPHEHATLDPAELTAFCMGRIATYKIPRYWKVTDSFPMTISGKVQKFKMREVSIEELGPQQAASVEAA
jgi:fatty-acyl-CoA synthase